MFISKIEKKNNLLKFRLANNNIPIGLANALRRIMMSEIPCLAIDENKVAFINNTSILHNTYLKKRLSLIPIFDNEVTADYKDLIIKLDTSNPDLGLKDVFVKDFQVFNDNKKLDNSKIFVFPEILFTQMKTDNKLHFEARLTKKTTQEGGACFNPTAVSIYNFEPDNQLITKKLKALSNASDRYEFKSLKAPRIYKKNKLDEPTAYMYTIESVGGIKPEEIFKYSLMVLTNKLIRLKNAIIDKDESILIIVEDVIIPNAIDYCIIGENDTLGNCLTNYIFRQKVFQYIGYTIPHPLDDKLVIRMSPTKDVNKIMCKQIDEILKIIKTLQIESKKM